MKTFDNTGEELFVENKDYELVPSNGENWDIRILTGDYTETVLKYGELKVSEDEEYMSFSFDVVSSPDAGLTDEDEGIQRHASRLLGSILNSAVTRLSDEPEDKK